MMILAFFSSRPFSIVICSLKFQNSCISWGTSLIDFGHPLLTVCFKSVRVSSLLVAPIMCCICRSLAQTLAVMQFTEILGRLIWLVERISDPAGRHDMQSASTLSFPLMYLTLKS